MSMPFFPRKCSFTKAVVFHSISFSLLLYTMYVQKLYFNKKECYCNYPANCKERHQRHQSADVNQSKDPGASLLAKTFIPVTVFHDFVYLWHTERAVWESCSVKFVMIFAQGKRDNKEPPFQQPEKAGVDTAQRGAAANLCSGLLQRHSLRFSCFPRMDVTTALQHRELSKTNKEQNQIWCF